MTKYKYVCPTAYLNENIPELKGFKELCKVTVVYLKEGTVLDDVSGFGKKLTVTYKVHTEKGEETVKTEKVVAGQYYNGGIPDEVVACCRKNGLLVEPGGNANRHQRCRKAVKNVFYAAVKVHLKS